MTTQTETTHTPGPWTVDAIDGGFLIGADKLNGSHIAQAMSAPDARLIAASPELLKIARDYLDVIKACVGGEENQTVNEVQNIIFKAEGRI